VEEGLRLIERVNREALKDTSPPEKGAPQRGEGAAVGAR